MVSLLGFTGQTFEFIVSRDNPANIRIRVFIQMMEIPGESFSSQVSVQRMETPGGSSSSQVSVQQMESPGVSSANRDYQLPSGVVRCRRAWVTLLTRPSYLPGAVLLAHSLAKHKSMYQLIILTTPSFPENLVDSLEKECSLSNARHIQIRSLVPPKRNAPEELIAERFRDTWAKLRVFELHIYGYMKLVFLDADMLVLRNMDDLFDIPLPDDWIAANHACVCNLDGDKWAPKDWTKENCAYTPLTKDSPPTSVPQPKDLTGKRTHTLLNSGLFIFTPFQEQWLKVLHFLQHDPRVKSYMFPDQDFLTDFFEGRWQSVGWEFNALKTMRYWHENIWDDLKVKNVHYIVDKPWSEQVTNRYTAGYLGHDIVTHRWWWKEYEKWESERKEKGELKIVEMMRSNTDRNIFHEAQEHLPFSNRWHDGG